MANQKKLIRIVAQVLIDATNDADVSVIGGNIARTIQGNIPTQYDVRGVEVESVTDVDENASPLREETPADKDTNIRAQRRAAAEEENKTLKT